MEIYVYHLLVNLLLKFSATNQVQFDETGSLGRWQIFIINGIRIIRESLLHEWPKNSL